MLKFVPAKYTSTNPPKPSNQWSSVFEHPYASAIPKNVSASSHTGLGTSQSPIQRAVRSAPSRSASATPSIQSQHRATRSGSSVVGEVTSSLEHFLFETDGGVPGIRAADAIHRHAVTKWRPATHPRDRNGRRAVRFGKHRGTVDSAAQCQPEWEPDAGPGIDKTLAQMSSILECLELRLYDADDEKEDDDDESTDEDDEALIGRPARPATKVESRFPVIQTRRARLGFGSAQMGMTKMTAT